MEFVTFTGPLPLLKVTGLTSLGSMVAPLLFPVTDPANPLIVVALAKLSLTGWALAIPPDIASIVTKLKAKKLKRPVRSCHPVLVNFFIISFANSTTTITNLMRESITSLSKLLTIQVNRVQIHLNAIKTLHIRIAHRVIYSVSYRRIRRRRRSDK